MTWEYKVESFRYGLYNTDESLQGALNTLGLEGWELVSVVPRIQGQSDADGGSVDVNELKLFLKRVSI
jgi:Domain of unknown function (DUF4177)